MPALSFSDVKFVKGILEGTKTQIIRPLFCKTCPHEPTLHSVTIKNEPEYSYDYIHKHYDLSTPKRFAVYRFKEVKNVQ